jgi:type II secretory pathway component GspD/PulD (secretin)
MALMRTAAAAILAAAALALPLRAQGDPVSLRNDSVTVRLVDADVRAAVQSLGRYLDKPVLFGAGVQGGRVTLVAPAPVPRSQVSTLLRSLLDSQGLEMVDAGGTYTVRGKQQAPQQPAFAPPPVTQGPRGSGGMQLFVIRLRHARAADVAAVVNSLYGRASALGEPGARGGGLADQLRQNRLPPGVPDVSQSQGPVPGAVTRREASLSGETTIVPDPRTNSLLIRANPDDFELIRAAVDQVDIRPLQVLIEVVIAEVQRNSDFALGLTAGLDTSRVIGSRTTVAGQTSGDLPSGGVVLRAMSLGGYDINATLAAASSRGDASVLSRPVLLATNNQRASISVGRQVPFVQLTTRSDAGIPTDVVQYRDVSTELEVTPTISPEGYVSLEVSQQVNSVESSQGGVKGNPVISSRSLETQLLVRDGQTGVLGGLSDQQKSTNRGGVPFLSNLPLIGWVFGNRASTNRDTELFIFLTPRVIRDDQGFDDATHDVRANTRRVGKLTKRVHPYVLPPPSKDHPDKANAQPVAPAGTAPSQAPRPVPAPTP